MRDFHSFVAYVATFVRYAMVIRTVIVVNLLWIVASGVAVAKFEGLKLGDGIYFAFVTALSVGYGDIAPKTTLGRVVSINLGFVGMLFIGVVVAIATRALRDTLKRLEDADDAKDPSVGR